MGGYNKIIDGLLKNIECRVGIDYFKEKENLHLLADNIVYTGKIDEFYGFCHGKLEYRSLHFDHQVLNTSNFQGNAVVNYTDSDTAFTRILEHKHFEFGTQKKTVITKEYPLEASNKNEPYYPINDTKNSILYQKYKKMSTKENIVFGGRLAEYKYYDMHQVIAAALMKTKKLFQNS